MQFFLDTAKPDEINTAHSWGILDGVTANPSHIAETGRRFRDVVADIGAVVPGPVSVEHRLTDSGLDQFPRDWKPGPQ